MDHYTTRACLFHNCLIIEAYLLKFVHIFLFSVLVMCNLFTIICVIVVRLVNWGSGLFIFLCDFVKTVCLHSHWHCYCFTLLFEICLQSFVNGYIFIPFDVIFILTLIFWGCWFKSMCVMDILFTLVIHGSMFTLFLPSIVIYINFLNGCQFTIHVTDICLHPLVTWTFA